MSLNPRPIYIGTINYKNLSTLSHFLFLADIYTPLCSVMYKIAKTDVEEIVGTPPLKKEKPTKSLFVLKNFTPQKKCFS